MLVSKGRQGWAGCPTSPCPHPPWQQPHPAELPLPHSPCWGSVPLSPPAAHPRGLHEQTRRTSTASAKFSPDTSATPPSVGHSPVDSRRVLAPAGLVPSEQGHSAAGGRRGLPPDQARRDFSEPPLQPGSSGSLCFPGKGAF